jgi:hypothetical protein
MSGKKQVTCARRTTGDGRSRATRLVRGVFAKPARSFAALAIAASVGGVWFQAGAAPPGGPAANRIFANCTFTTDSLRRAITIKDPGKKLAGALQASYILIYVRQNPNDGQLLGGTTPTFTGPVLCINSKTESIDQTTETTATPTVDILGTEEAFHLQYRNPSGPSGPIEKRVCHTVATNTDCFLIRAPQ